MTYKDVELLQQSLGGLAQTFQEQNRQKQEKQRFNQEQQRLGQQAQALEQYRTSELGLQQTKAQQEEEYRRQMLGIQSDKVNQGSQKLADDLKKNAVKMHLEGFNTISKAVKDGVISPEQGTQMIKQGAAKIPDTIKDDPSIQMLSSPDFQFTKPSPKMPATATVGGKEVIYNPETGSFKLTSESSPQDASERNLAARLALEQQKQDLSGGVTNPPAFYKNVYQGLAGQAPAAPMGGAAPQPAPQNGLTNTMKIGKYSVAY